MQQENRQAKVFSRPWPESFKNAQVEEKGIRRSSKSGRGQERGTSIVLYPGAGFLGAQMQINYRPSYHWGHAAVMLRGS